MKYSTCFRYYEPRSDSAIGRVFARSVPPFLHLKIAIACEGSSSLISPPASSQRQHTLVNPGNPTRKATCVRFPGCWGSSVCLSVCLTILDSVTGSFAPFVNEPMRKLAKSRRYQGLLLLSCCVTRRVDLYRALYCFYSPARVPSPRLSSLTSRLSDSFSNASVQSVLFATRGKLRSVSLPVILYASFERFAKLRSQQWLALPQTARVSKI
jgi:hypothetical protein